MTAPNSVETLFSPAGSSAAGSLPASRSSSAAGATRRPGGGDSGGSAAVKGREGAAVSEATAVEGLEDNSPAVCGREDSTAVASETAAPSRPLTAADPPPESPARASAEDLEAGKEPEPAGEKVSTLFGAVTFKS